MSINVRWVTTDSVDFSGRILFRYHFPATEIASQAKILDDGSRSPLGVLGGVLHSDDEKQTQKPSTCRFRWSCYVDRH